MAKKVIGTLVIIILLGAIAGISYWAYTQGYFDEYLNKDTTAKQDSQEIDQTSQPAKQAADENQDEQQKSDETQADSDQKDQQSNEDDRIVLTIDNLAEINNELGCNIRFNTKKANDYIDYEGFGISCELPFNKDWGSSNYAIEPFDEYPNYIDFGNVFIYDNCTWVREFRLSVKPFRDVQEIRTALKNQGYGDQEIKEIKINDVVAVYHQDQGQCDYLTFEVVGSKYNYVFTNTCGTDYQRDEEIIRKIISSIHFLGKMFG